MKRAPKYLSIILALLVFAGILKATLPPIVIGSWTPTAPLSQPRANAATVMLSDGSTLFIGGDNGSGPLQSAEVFSANGVVSSAGLMNVARSRHFAVVLSDGRVLVGGGNTGGGVTNSAEIYDPNAGSWTLTTPMTSARANATAALLQDGRVLIAGGDNAGVPNNTIEIFDPAAGSFGFAGTMSSPRTQHAMAVLQDRRVLIVGGFDGTDPLASSEIFDPATGNVNAGPSLATARYLFSATTMLNGQVAVIGGAGNNGSGATDLASIEIFDPSSGAFITSSATLSNAREGHLAFLLPNNNSVLAVGGTSNGTTLSTAELVIPQISTSDGSWSFASSPAASMSAARSGASGAANQVNGPTSVVQRNGFVVVGGGADAAGNALSSTEAYGFPTVQTDASDYPPGSTVSVSGSGFQPGESVTITLVESPLIDTHGPYTVTADGNGNFSDSSFATDIHDVNVRFYLSATGNQSGAVAQNTFADANLSFLTNQFAIPANACSPLVQIQQSSSANVTVTLSSSSANGKFYSDAACTALISGNQVTTSNLVPSVASFYYKDSSTGSPTITISDSAPPHGDSNTQSETISGALTPTTLTLAVPSPSSFNYQTTSSIALSATLKAGGSGVNKEAVEFFVDGIFTGNSNTGNNGSGTASLNYNSSALSIGSHTVQAIFEGDNASATKYAASTSGTQTLTVNKRTSATSLICSPATVGTGVATTCSATVTDNDTGTAVGPTGTVTFADAPVSGAFTPAASCSLGAPNGSSAFCSVSYKSSTAGAETITGSYAGDSTHATSSNSSNVTVVLGPTISKGFSPSTINVNATSTLTLTITNPSSNTVPLTGLAFTDSFPAGLIVASTPNVSSTCGGTFTATAGSSGVALSGGTVAVNSTCSINVAITASASGTLNNTTGPLSSTQTGTGATSNTASLTVNNPATTLTVAPATGAFGGTAALSATLTLTNGGTPVSGKTIDFTLNGSSVGSAITNASGVASVSSASLTGISAGNYPTGVAASFAGDATDLASSGTAALSVSQASAAINVTAYNVLYDGSAHTASATAIGVGGANLAADLNLSGTAHTSAGDYPGDSWTFHDPSGNYADASGTVHDVIGKVNANIVVTPYSVTYDGAAHTATGTATGVGAIDLSAGLNLAGTTHTSAATYNDTWTFTDTTGNYNNANGNVQDVIGQATATIAVVPYNLTYDGNPHSATGTAVGSGGVDLSADLNLVNTVHTTAATYNDLWSFSDPSGNYAPAGGTISDIINQASPTLTWNTPAAITYGTALSGTQLNATANIPGTFAYNPPAGTVLAAGTHQPMVVLFTPTDSVDYKTQNAPVYIDVNPAMPRIIWQNPADISYPATLGSTQLNATAPAIPLGVTAWWTADEGTGTTSQDAVGSDVATLKNAASWGTGQYNSAFSLQANNQQYVDTGNTPNLQVSSGDFSVAAWVQFNSLSGDMSIVDKMLDQNTANDNGWRLLKQSDNHFWFCVGQNINANTCQPGWLESSTTAQTGQWYHVVAVKTSNSLSLYINGVQEATNSIGPIVDDNTGNLLIGANTKQGAYLDGMIDEVQLFNHALSATEVQNIYNRTVPGNFVYTPPSGTQLNAGNNQTLSTTFNPTDGTNYNTAQKNVSINVLKGTQVITFAALAGHTFGDQPFMVSATGGGSGNPVTFTATGNCSSGGTNGSTITITGAGSCTVNADQAGDSNYNPAATVQQSFAISKATPTVIATGGTFTFDGNAHAGSGSATGVLTPPDVLAPVDLSYVGVSGTIYGPSATAPTSAGNYTVTASFGGDSNYNSATSTAVALTINKANPTVTATGGTFTYDGNTHAGSGSATGVLTPPDALAPVTLSYVGVSGTSYGPMATAPTNAGNYTVTASFAGNGNYNSGTSTAVALTINKANPTVTATGGTYTYDGNPHAGNGSATGVLTPPDALAPVTLSYVGVSGTSYGPMATAPTNAGNYTVTASFSGNSNYNPGTSTAAALTINKATPLVAVSFAASPITYDGGSHPATAVVTGVNNTVLTPADGTVTITYTPGGATAPLSAGTYTASASFSSNNPNYTDGSSTSSASLTINKATPVVTVSFAATPITYDGGSHPATAVVTGVNNTPLTPADGTVTITYTPGGTTAPLNAGTYTAAATFTSANTNYTNASSTTSASLTINKALANISVTPYSLTYDALPHTASATATGVKGEALSGLDLSGTTHTNAGDYPNDPWMFSDPAGNYANANGTVHDSIAKANPVITWANPAPITYGTVLSGAQLNATASVPGSLVYSPGSGTLLKAGTAQTLSVSFTPADTIDYNSGVQNVTIDVLKATPNMTWPIPPTIVYGTPLSSTQLNATFAWTVAGSQVNVPGTATYTTATNAPAPGAVLMPGQAQSLNVSFTPTDTTDYNPAASNAMINVVFATGGTCNNGLASGVILQPINSDGTSVFKAGSTVPTKFVVCDAFGNSVGPIAGASIVKSYTVAAATNGTVTGVDELQYSTTPDQYFRWDPTAQQWIFNQATGKSSNLTGSGATYLFQITLIDGTVINGTNRWGAPGYQYGLR